jgi:hypothetical protein
VKSARYADKKDRVVSNASKRGSQYFCISVERSLILFPPCLWNSSEFKL